MKLTNDLFFAPVSKLGPLLRARKISPVELAEGYLERLVTLGAPLGAVAALMRETALDEARMAEREIRAPSLGRNVL